VNRAVPRRVPLASTRSIEVAGQGAPRPTAGDQESAFTRSAAMEITRTFHAPDRASWRRWLQEHHRVATEVWLVNFRKAAGKPGVAYNDAVEEALCFGWVDSTRKRMDADRLVQRFSPRRSGSPYSQANRERLRRLVESGRVDGAVLATVEPVLREPFSASSDVLAALQEDATGWVHFQRYSPAYQRIRIAYVESARARPEDFDRRLRHLRRMNAKDRQFGHGIETYF
jgi:uncharacterized protein YdeI (YjbR/CyaY-like superfamily)